MGCQQSSSGQDTLMPQKRPKVDFKNNYGYQSNNNDLNNSFQSSLNLNNFLIANNSKTFKKRLNLNDIESISQYLQDLFSQLDGNLQKFFQSLQQNISQIYMYLSKQTLDKMNQKQLQKNQSKVLISQQILWLNLNILKVVSRKTKHKFNPGMFKLINKLQKNLVGYLKMKYPRQTQTFVPGDLMAIFKQFDLSQDNQFDILKNSNTYFGSTDQNTIAIQLKIFINKLIDQLDNNFPRFQKMMQQKVFIIKNDDQTFKTLNYKIGRKIPQNVSKYNDTESNTLQINSPQIFRTLIKWSTNLQQIITQPSQNINTKKNFKCFIQKNQKGKILFDQINQEQHFTMINNDLIENILNERNDYFKHNSDLLGDMDKFNSHLLKLLDTSIRKQKFIPIRQAQTIKYSNLNAKFISWVLAQKLILAIKKLVSIGKSFYSSEQMITLDLIQFKVNDLMRCMVSGNKKQILALYKNIKKLQQNGQIKIVKIKNRLASSLNDIMIMFAMKNSYLICQLQIILSDSAQKINQKYHNISTLNHFFYQLQRSPYGVLSQFALLLAYKDSKVSYQDKITFETNQNIIDTCQKQHKQSVISSKYQTKPFICTKCTKFYFKYENIFLMKYCQLCNVFICGKCLFQNNKKLQQSIINKQIQLKIQESVNYTLTKMRSLSSFSGISGILKAFKRPFVRLQKIFGSKKVQISKLSNYLYNQLVKPNNYNKQLAYIPFLLLSFRKGQAQFKCLNFMISKQIQNPFDSNQTFYQKDFFYFSQYDMLLFFDKQVKRQVDKSLNDGMLYMLVKQKYLQGMMSKMGKFQDFQIGYIQIDDFKLIIDFKNLSKQKKNALMKKKSIEVQNLNYQSVNYQKSSSKIFKYQSVHQLLQKLPDSLSAKSLLYLNDLGIYTPHLIFLDEIDWTQKIKQLKLSKNFISNIDIVLQKCINIERLYVNQNFITNVSFNTQLINFDILNGSNNQIKVLNGLNKIKNISKLILDKNKITKFQQCSLKNLKYLNLNDNNLEDVGYLLKSDFPTIQQLYLNTQIYIYEDKRTSTILGEQLIIGFPKLKSISMNYVFQKISILSLNIERINLKNNLSNIINIPPNSLKNLKNLNITTNQLDSLQFLFPISSNHQNNIISEINVQGNIIQDFPIIKSSSLKKFNIKSNKLVSLVNLQISYIPNLQQLDLQFNQIETVCKLNLPKLIDLDLSSNPIKDASNLQNSILTDLQLLKISQCQIEQFPMLKLEKLKQLFLNSIIFNCIKRLSECIIPKLQCLQLKCCDIDCFPLLNLKQLQTITLRQSQICNLDNLQKSNLPNLIHLDLSNVRMEFFDQELQNQHRQELQKQNKQHIKTTQINSSTVKKSKFQCNFNFPKLKTLLIQNTDFKSIDGLQKNNLPELQELSINYCKIVKQPKINIKNLKILNAISCQLQNIQSILNSNLVNLQQLNLSNNFIKQVKINSMPTLRILNLSINRIQQIQFAFEMNQLQQLNLQTNKLVRFPKILANKLTKLNLLKNEFTSIKQLSNCQLNKLQSFKIQQCKLSEQPFPTIKLYSLKSLYCQRCNIRDISNLQFSLLPLIQDINFNENQLITLPVMKFSMLKFLRLNNNKFNDISNLSNSQLAELNTLELQQNQITILPYLPFPSLKRLFMHINKLNNVQGFIKSPFNGLKILNACYQPQLTQFPLIKAEIEELYITGTKIFDVIKLNQVKNLRKIHMNQIGIKEIPQLNQKFLTDIQFQDNQLQDISEFAKGSYPQAIEVTFKGNKIKNLPLFDMFKLKRLFFDNNILQSIQDFISGSHPDLQILTINVNKLNKISKLPFPSLKQLYISDNPFQQINFFNHSEYNSLKFIVSVNTQIKKIQKLPRMNNIQKIWLNNSKLTNLNWLMQSVDNLKSLIYFAAPSNLIQQLPSFKGLKINQLYLDNNPITKYSKFIENKQQLLKIIYICKISIKTNDDNEFLQVNDKLNLELNYIANITKYPG